jgi:hypothetical protein
VPGNDSARNVHAEVRNVTNLVRETVCKNTTLSSMIRVVGGNDVPRRLGVRHIEFGVFLKAFSLATSLVTIDHLPGRSVSVADLARSGPHDRTVFFV